MKTGSPRHFISAIMVFLVFASCKKELPDAPTDELLSTDRPAGCRYIDKTGKVAVNPTVMITDGFDFTEGLAGVRGEEGKLGFIDKTGALVIPFAFFDGTSFRQGTAGVLEDGMCGYIDRTGKLIIPLKYDSVTNFREGWGRVKRNGAWTYVNARGEEMSQWFVDSESFSEGLAAVAPVLPEAGVGERARFGYVDLAGKIIVAPRFDDAEPFSEGLAAVLAGGKWGYIDKKGKLVIAPQFEAAGPFSEGLAQVRMGNKMGYIDAKGRIVIEPHFELDTRQEDPDEKIEMTGRFVEGLACVRFALGPEAGAGWGFINTAGKFVIPPLYENADMFAEELAAVQQNGKWGFIDRKGNLAVPATYDRVKRFSEGLALVQGGTAPLTAGQSATGSR